MRPCFLVLIPLVVFGPSAGATSSVIGLPAHTFALSWTSLPTGQISLLSPTGAPVATHPSRAAPLPDGKMGRVLDEAFASAADDRTRREIALDEMMAPWDQPQRSSFQRLRETESAYAGDDGARRDQFATLLSRVVDGTGRSVAHDGSAPAALDTAYVAALSRQDDTARGATESAQKAFVAFRDAFAAFADGRSPGTGAGVTDELDRQRAADLAR